MSIIKRLYIIISGIISSLAICISGCSSYNDTDNLLDISESLMESMPDSALSILNNIDGDSLNDRRLRARHALLKSMALDKNYIDTTTFEVLQPAIDYYINKNKGNADEKFRTYYYKSVIYMNADDVENAMQAHLNALDIEEAIKDSLTLARLLVAQGSLYYRLYRIDNFIVNNLLSADIYGHLDLIPQQLRCYARVLNGEVILRNRANADSIYNICESIFENNPQFRHLFLRCSLMYYKQFGNKDEIKKLLEEVLAANVTDDMKMSLAKAYTKIGESETGLRYLEGTKLRSDDIFDSLTYWTVKTEIFENLGKDRGALASFRNYSKLLETYHTTLFSNELLFSEKKHKMEVENMDRIRKKDDIIKWISFGVIVLICMAGLIYYRYRLNKAARIIAEQNTEKLQLETYRLQLEADNLRLTVGQLEDERERLRGVLERQDEFSTDMRRILHDRLELLNGLLASEITKEESHAREYRKYVESIRKNKKKFLREIRRDIETTHSEFFTDLKDRGLTDKEVDYVCLYAIGLRGKEIGTYLEVAGHYNISSEIRKKFGLDANGENLGPYIRKMMKEDV